MSDRGTAPRPSRDSYERRGGYPSGTKPISELPRIPDSLRSPQSEPPAPKK